MADLATAAGEDRTLFHFEALQRSIQSTWAAWSSHPRWKRRAEPPSLA